MEKYLDLNKKWEKMRYFINGIQQIFVIENFNDFISVCKKFIFIKKQIIKN